MFVNNTKHQAKTKNPSEISFSLWLLPNQLVRKHWETALTLFAPFQETGDWVGVLYYVLAVGDPDQKFLATFLVTDAA